MIETMIKAKKAKQAKKVIKNLIKSMVFDDCIVCNKYNDFVMNNIIKITECYFYYRIGRVSQESTLGHKP